MRIQGKDGVWYEVPDCIFGDRDGSTYIRQLDRVRLDTEAALAFIYLATHGWSTPGEVAKALEYAGYATSGITARFRDYRKDEFGNHTVRCRRRKGARKGEYEYLLEDPPDVDGAADNEPWPASPPSGTLTAPPGSTDHPPPSRSRSTGGWRIAPSSP